MAEELASRPQLAVSDVPPVPHCDATMASTVENVRKLLAPFTGTNNSKQQNDAELCAVPLRQMPVSARDVPKHLIRGEVMDFIVQHIDSA